MRLIRMEKAWDWEMWGLLGKDARWFFGFSRAVRKEPPQGAAARSQPHVADQCRTMGLQIGDTIEGTEGGDRWWNTTRLTLLWLGEQEAVWRMTSVSSSHEVWSEPREVVNWTLSCRDWKKISEPPR